MLRRTARQHETLRTQAGVRSEDYWDFKPGDRVNTTDGYPGRVEAVFDGPFPGAAEYDVKLDGGMGGGIYTAAQLRKMADEEYTATKDYPELAEILAERPDPGKQVILAKKTASTLPEDHNDKVYLRFGHWPKDERSTNNVMGWKEDGVSVYDLNHHGEPVDPDANMGRWHEHDESCGPDCEQDQFNEDYSNNTGEEMDGRVQRAEHNRGKGRDLAGETGHLVKGKMVGIGHDGEPLLHNVRRVGDWIDHRHLFIPSAEPHHLARHPLDDDYEEPEETPKSGLQQRLYSRTATTINDVKIDDHGDAPHELRADNPNAYDKKSTEGKPDPHQQEPLDKDKADAYRGAEIMKAPAGVSFGVMSPAQEQHVEDREDARQDVVDKHRQVSDARRDRMDAADIQRVEDPAYAKYLDHLSSLVVSAEWNDPEEGLDHHRDHDWGGIDSGHGEGGEWHDPEEARCYYKHNGPCPELGDVEPKFPMGHHTAMPSKMGPAPEDFNYRVEETGSRYPGASTHALYGFVGPHHVGTLHFTKSDDDRAVKVDMLHHHDPIGGAKGVGSAMMDALYDEHPEAWINHGERSRQGLKWWSRYQDPAPERNVHNQHPSSGWDEYFHPRRVSLDMAENYMSGQEGNPLPHNSEAYGEPEREDDGTPKDLHGPHWGNHHWAQGHDGGRVHDDEELQSHARKADDEEHEHDEHDGLDDVLFPGGNAWDHWYERAHATGFDLPGNGGRTIDDPERKAEVAQHNSEFPEKNHQLFSENAKEASSEDFWNKRIPEIHKEHQGSSDDERLVDRMRSVGDPHEEGYAYIGDGGHWCPSCKAAREMHGQDTSDMEPRSWSDLRRGGPPEGEACSDCGSTLTPPRPHSERHCPAGEECPSADEDHDENLNREEKRRYIHDNAHRFDKDKLAELKDHYDKSQDRPVNSRGPGEAPLHMSEQEEANRDWGGHDDFHSTLMEHEDHAQAIKHQRAADDQLKGLFSGPEFDEHRQFMEQNGRGPTHYSSKTGHLILPLMDESGEHELRRHLMDHHSFSADQLADLVDPGQGDAAAMAHEGEHDMIHDEGLGGHGYGAGETETLMPHKHDEEDHSGGGRWVTDTQLVPERPGFMSMNKRLSDPYSLVAEAATDPGLRFHFTASWSDVRAKAKRIRTEGKVRVTLATDGMIIGEVQGDHHTYESGIQRLPGQRLSVSGWSCGCKWGAYHWGAEDDFSRFAGRMCSHALALQFEAQSRGMFGNVVEIDKSKPDWVPPRVVVKHDIDSGQNRLVRSSAKHAGEMRPVDIFAFFAMHQEGETTSGIQMLLRTAGLIEAAVNDPWGEPSVETPPKPYGSTSPANPYQSPASAGPLTAQDPDSWGRLDASGMSVTTTLHDDPEGALPSTDGDLENEDLEPENPSIMTVGQAAEVSRQIMLKAERERTELAEREANQIGGDDEIMDVTAPGQSEDDIVAQFQASAAGKALMEENGNEGPISNSDIAKHAQRVLALKAFSPAEQAALINEGMDVQASNLDRLDIAGTHYAELDDEGDLEWTI